MTFLIKLIHQGTDTKKALQIHTNENGNVFVHTVPAGGEHDVEIHDAKILTLSTVNVDAEVKEPSEEEKAAAAAKEEAEKADAAKAAEAAEAQAKAAADKEAAAQAEKEAAEKTEGTEAQS